MANQLHIAAVAVAVVDGMPAENYARAFRLAQIASERKPDIILLPEAFASGYCSTNLAPYAEPVGCESLNRFKELSRVAGCMIVIGCLLPGDAGNPDHATKVRNAVAVFDRGELLGVHVKSSIWPDDRFPYRDERKLLVPGDGVKVFDTRFGRIAVLICYENMIIGNWSKIPREVDLVLSPYNCEDDPGVHNLKGSALIGKPSAWANRTGTVMGESKWYPNLGSAGAVDKNGVAISRSTPGVEDIVYVTLEVGA